jgi:hypothetical protein
MYFVGFVASHPLMMINDDSQRDQNGLVHAISIPVFSMLRPSDISVLLSVNEEVIVNAINANFTLDSHSKTRNSLYSYLQISFVEKYDRSISNHTSCLKL